MTAKRDIPQRRGAERRRGRQGSDRRTRRGPADVPPRSGQPRANGADKSSARSAPQTTPITRPTRAKNTSQAKARAKARKAKAPKVVRPPLRERLIARLSEIEVNPRALATKVPFVVLVIGSLAIGLGLTLWLSTDSAKRSYELGNARETNRVLTQQKDALERDVLQAQAAPALAEAARNLGMIPSRDTAHLVQDPAGNWIVVGTPKPAAGTPPPPLNTPLPPEKPPLPPVNPIEVPVRVTPPNPAALPGAPTPGVPGLGPEVMVRTPSPATAAASAPEAGQPPGLSAEPPPPVAPTPVAAATPQVATTPLAAQAPPEGPPPINVPAPSASDEHIAGLGPQTPGPAA
jgi:hypothetical protein